MSFFKKLNSRSVEKLTIKNIIEFRTKRDINKGRFVEALKKPKPKDSEESGGNYWASCLSAIGNSYQTNDHQFIANKIDELEAKHNETEYKKTKTMYRRNINILSNYKNVDFKKMQPSEDFEIIRKSIYKPILTIKGLPVQSLPSYVFTFQTNNVKEIGAIWFVAKLNGYKKEELGMFCDMLYRYLKTHFSNRFTLSSKYCMAVDIFKGADITYSQLEKGQVPFILDSTLEEIKKLM